MSERAPVIVHEVREFDAQREGMAPVSGWQVWAEVTMPTGRKMMPVPIALCPSRSDAEEIAELLRERYAPQAERSEPVRHNVFDPGCKRHLPNEGTSFETCPICTPAKSSEHEYEPMPPQEQGEHPLCRVCGGPLRDHDESAKRRETE